MTRLSPHHLGILYAITGFTAWIFAGTCMKFVSETSMPKYEITALMSLSAILSMAVITALRGKMGNLRAKRPARLVILGIILLADITAALFAYQYLPLVNVYVITFLTPILTAILAPIVLRERVNALQMLMVVTGFLGVIVAIDPFHADSGEGNWIGYAGAFFLPGTSTITTLLLRFYSESEHHESMAFYPRIVVAVGTLLPCALWDAEPVSMSQLISTTGAGFFAGIGYLFITVASQKIPASVSAPYRYSQIISAALLGYLIWNDIPTPHLFVGAAIIIASGLYILLRPHPEC